MIAIENNISYLVSINACSLTNIYIIYIYTNNFIKNLVFFFFYDNINNIKIN